MIQSKKTLFKTLLVLNALFFSALAVWDHYEDVEDVIFENFEVIAEHDYDDYDFPTKISRSLESSLVEFERIEQIKVVDFLLSIIVPYIINQEDHLIEFPYLSSDYEFFNSRSICINAP
ncbi:hypothetical protein [Cecembia lonarensis]|uniref:Uncharacterized protein n=1 Tax=Cecembia lonarensis (strain CCUG 58316 / KCTC 22772 / LW9) TaxID=1225176 RepID=K1LDZ5_CECL9|nr:hypothetical protein [Cecembia lonarensis]EKB50387.1 hypothetical protein B879_00936 [Cecembia lonarensis LW9]